MVRQVGNLSKGHGNVVRWLGTLGGFRQLELHLGMLLGDTNRFGNVCLGLWRNDDHH
jgi:hypothetical protein